MECLFVCGRVTRDAYMCAYVRDTDAKHTRQRTSTTKPPSSCIGLHALHAASGSQMDRSRAAVLFSVNFAVHIGFVERGQMLGGARKRRWPFCHSLSGKYSDLAFLLPLGG